MKRLIPALMLATLAVCAAKAEPLTSARELLSPELQAQQADDGANPGMLWVERGANLWTTPDGQGAKSCAGCHGDAKTSMRGVATRYPSIDTASGTLMNLEARINSCRVKHMSAVPFKYETDDLLGLTAYVAHLSRGLSMAPRIDGPAAPRYEAGRKFYFERQGQHNLACNQCHEAQVGKRLRGDRISSGLGTGYPAYRLDWQRAGSLHRRLRACSLGVRAEQLEYGAPEYVDLELYLAHRASGMSIETPAVRK